MTRRIRYDVETRSKCDLKQHGGRVYSLDPSTEVLCVVLECEGGYSHWQPGDRLPRVLHGEFECWAHNGTGFDRHIWANVLRWPAPVRHVDTAQLARVAGYPKADLDYLGETLLGAPKDKEGSALTKKLSSKNARWPEFFTKKKIQYRHPMAGEWKQPKLPKDVLDRVLEYCYADVTILVGIAELLAEFDAIDREYREFHTRMIDRGVGFDAEMAEALVLASDYLAAQSREEAGIDLETVRSNDKFRARMAELGYPIENARKETLAPMLEDEDLDEEVRDLLTARLGTNTIAAGKLRAGLRRCLPDPVEGHLLRDNQIYHGAHTGRDTGEGMQLLNLTKPA